MKTFFYALFLILSFFLVLSFNLNEYFVDENRFIIYESNPANKKLKFYWKDSNGKIYGSIQKLKNSLNLKGTELIFAVNGGMYNKDKTPQGLFIEDHSIKKQKENRTEGYGNFYLQPNGIFYLTEEGKGKIVKTIDFCPIKYGLFTNFK